MTLSEMHAWFRQYAQQMGMQNVRAILPEQIDTLINTSTKDTIDEIINRNVGTTNDRVITDNAKLANINALRTLYKVKEYAVPSTPSVANYKTLPLALESSTVLGDSKALYFVDFSVRYDKGSKTTRWFPIRIIDDAYLADVLNDWVLAPRLRTPVMVIYSNPTGTPTILDNSRLEIYFGENDTEGIDTLTNSLTISTIRMSYIKQPNKVTYVSDIGGSNVESDLPDQLQIPMLKHAVDLYRASIQGSLFASQQQGQEQQRENVRNNARPDNEGYQS